MSTYRKPALVQSVPKYSDFGIDLNMHPTTRDVAKVSEFDCVKRSIRSLVMTNRYERLLDPGIGSNIRGILFEPMDPATTIMLRDYIEETIRNYEPRAILQNVVIEPDYDHQLYYVKIIFSMASSNQQTAIELFLQRIR